MMTIIKPNSSTSSSSTCACAEELMACVMAHLDLAGTPKEWFLSIESHHRYKAGR